MMLLRISLEDQIERAKTLSSTSDPYIMALNDRVHLAAVPVD